MSTKKIEIEIAPQNDSATFERAEISLNAEKEFFKSLLIYGKKGKKKILIFLKIILCDMFNVHIFFKDFLQILFKIFNLNNKKVIIKHSPAFQTCYVCPSKTFQSKKFQKWECGDKKRPTSPACLGLIFVYKCCTEVNIRFSCFVRFNPRIEKWSNLRKVFFHQQL